MSEDEGGNAGGNEELVNAEQSEGEELGGRISIGVSGTEIRDRTAIARQQEPAAHGLLSGLHAFVFPDQAPVVEVDGKTDENKAEVGRCFAVPSGCYRVNGLSAFSPFLVVFLPPFLEQ